MIIFDYGHTLLYEPGCDYVRGNAELLKYAIKNPNNCTLEDVRKGVELIFGEHAENVRKIGYDISGQICDRALYEYLGIEFSLSPLEMETIFSDRRLMSSSVTIATSMMSIPFPFGAVRAAVIIWRTACNTCAWRISLSFCIIFVWI